MPLPFESESGERRGKRFKRRAGFDVFTRKRRKLVRLNPIPLSKASARDLGASHVDRTLRASFLVKKSNRSGFGKIPIGIKGSFSKLRSQFRLSKRTKGLLVEKNKYRLNTPGELEEIKRARRMRVPKSLLGLKRRK